MRFSLLCLIVLFISQLQSNSTEGLLQNGKALGPSNSTEIGDSSASQGDKSEFPVRITREDDEEEEDKNEEAFYGRRGRRSPGGKGYAGAGGSSGGGGGKYPTSFGGSSQGADGYGGGKGGY